MRSGNWALVTRKEEMRRACSSPIRRLISGYIIGSPTSDSAQWRTCREEAMSVLANQYSTAHYITQLLPTTGTLVCLAALYGC